ncbi:MAG: Gfo/Idh/MocA family oxidoreductase [Candidatus Melainabacteria bacterium]|nr:Gfo/Idh/MocA family oxidoreductase [Candidatus Melainabacteria bacterium]
MTQPPTVLLIGCGRWGQNWANTLFDLNALAGICDPRPEIVALANERWPGVPVYPRLEIALLNSTASACVVATPAETHLETASHCMQAHKAVLVEKPLALTENDAQAMLTLAKAQDVTLAVGHLLLYHSGFMALKEQIEAGVLGDIRSIHCTRMNLGTVRNEENVWWSFAPHDLSLLVWLLDGVPLQTVSATGHALLGRPQLPDRVEASFQSADQSTDRHVSASIHTSWYHPIKRHETIVVGTKAIAVLEDTLQPEEKLKILPVQADWKQEQVTGLNKQSWQSIPLEAAPPLTQQAKAFLAAVPNGWVGGESLPNSGQNGLAVVQLLAQTQALLSATVPTHPAVGEALAV